MPKIYYQYREKIGNCYFIEDLTTGKNRRALFECYCGRQFESKVCHVKSKQTQSCGCLNSKLAAERLIKHGQAPMKNPSKEYTTWACMKQRCYDEKCKSYINYGGRGIVVCENWCDNFSKFYEDMGKRPSKEYSIDRIDVNGNYCKENCRWATKKEQNRNRRTNIFVTYKDKTQCISAWAEELKISFKVFKRIIKTKKLL